jgi:hypothetical protein
MIRTEDIENLENVIIDDGYHLRYGGLFESKNQMFYSFKLYLDNGQGYGDFNIPVCPNCLDETDVMLWVKDQFHILYPELFKGSNI